MGAPADTASSAPCKGVIVAGGSVSRAPSLNAAVQGHCTPASGEAAGSALCGPNRGADDASLAREVCGSQTNSSAAAFTGPNPALHRLRSIKPCHPVTVTFNNIHREVAVSTRTGWKALPVLGLLASIGRPKQKKKLLCGVSGTIRPGEMVALMGASGAGKSTLLNVLSMRTLDYTGTLLFNDRALSAQELKRICCFIQQTDLFYGFLTVAEHLDCVARLRTGQPEAARANLVNTLVNLYGLAKVKDSQIGNIHMGARRGISGGEKKRLNIASEVMTNPSVIFADEPTTGLDATTAEGVMEIFKLLAEHGRTIICTIHQPSASVFEMFNRVLLLSEGRIVFFGDRRAALPYFSRLGYVCPAFTTAADFLVELLVKQSYHAAGKVVPEDKEAHELSAAELVALWEESGRQYLEEWEANVREQGSPSSMGDASQPLGDPSSANTGSAPPPIPERYQASGWEEFLTLLHRGNISNRRNPRVFKARLGQCLALALLIGLIYFRLDPTNYVSRNGASTFICINQGSLGLVAVLQTFTSDKILAIREYQSGLYGLTSYYFAKITSDFGFQTVLPIIFGTIVWFMVGFNDLASRWAIGLAFIILVTNSAISIGYLVSSVAPSLQTATALIPLIMMPLSLVAGFMVILCSIPSFWIWLQYLSPFRWGWSGIMRAVWEGVMLDQCPPEQLPPLCFSSGEQILEYYCIADETWWFAATILIVQIIVYRGLALLALKLINRRH